MVSPRGLIRRQTARNGVQRLLPNLVSLRALLTLLRLSREQKQPARFPAKAAVLAIAAALVAIATLLRHQLVKKRPLSDRSEPGRTESRERLREDFSPQPSNYDLGGPAANSATPVPAPDTQTLTAIDEEAEIAAAAAQAAKIGGDQPGYVAEDLTLSASEEQRPLAEAGEGEAEGMEQTEAQLVEKATAPEGSGDRPDPSIEGAIANANNPFVGEHPEPLPADSHGRASSSGHNSKRKQSPAQPEGPIAPSAKKNASGRERKRPKKDP